MMLKKICRIGRRRETGMQKFEYERYARLLCDWVVFARRDLYACPDTTRLSR